MAKIFSLIGIPSPKNYILTKIPFIADQFAHASGYLFLAAT
jgi:hypothetical protein